MNILEIKNLKISFFQYEKWLKRRKLNIVKDLSLKVEEDEIVAIFGASGSGKSLLAHAIMMLLPYNSEVQGEIYYRGELITRKNIESLRGERIWFIPQTINSLNPILKIKNQINILNKKVDKSKYKDLLNKFALDESVLEKYPFELSGGMARRLLVCEAIMSQADLIIADEPTPGMDNMGVEETISFFRSLKESGKSALVITHDIEMALKFADKIAIFLDGEIVDIKKSKDFSNLENLKHPYTRKLFNALPENGFEIEGE